MADQTLRIVLTGGGSGGHAYPLLAVAESLRDRAPKAQFSADITYLGPKDAYAALFKNANIATRFVASGKIRRYLSLRNITDIPKFFIGFFQALWHLYFIMPDVIFSKGGTGAFPVVLAGWFYRIPVVVHDSDAKPGLTNIASSFFAKKIFISFDAAAKYFNPNITSRTGVPVRLRACSRIRRRKSSRKKRSALIAAKPLLLMLGGSQGAERINNFILTNLLALMQRAQVFHQVGAANFAEVNELSDAHCLMLRSRTGTRRCRISTIRIWRSRSRRPMSRFPARAAAHSSNSARSGCPPSLIPHDSGSNGHQRMNAYDFAKDGAAIVIEEPNLLPGHLSSEIEKILSNPELQQKMSAAAKQFFVPDAADAIVDGILSVVK